MMRRGTIDLLLLLLNLTLDLSRRSIFMGFRRRNPLAARCGGGRVLQIARGRTRRRAARVRPREQAGGLAAMLARRRSSENSGVSAVAPVMIRALAECLISSNLHGNRRIAYAGISARGHRAWLRDLFAVR